MRCLELTLPTAEENLALDEALLCQADAAGRPLEGLRLWEAASPMVVVGRSSRIAAEVHQQACREANMPVLRRISGGASIVAGPGCLMYALVLSLQRRPGLSGAERLHRTVLGKIVEALRPHVPDVCHRGISDLAMGELKFSGNSVRQKREHVLYHGTLLYGFPLHLIDRYLKTPPRQPEYRSQREHQQFVCNLPLAAKVLRQLLKDAWTATAAWDDWPAQLTARLVSEKYGRPQWNEQL